MMGRLIQNVIITARKDRNCDACLFLRDNLSSDCSPLLFSELRSIIEAKKLNWKIKKGEKYLRQTCEDGGQIYTFCARIEIDRICLKYDLYPKN